MTVTLNPGYNAGNAGTGATYKLLGTDLFGGISLTTGTGTAGGTVLDLVMSVAPCFPSIDLVPLDPTTAAVTSSPEMNPYGLGACYNPKLGITLNNSIADNTTYNWAYRIS